MLITRTARKVAAAVIGSTAALLALTTPAAAATPLAAPGPTISVGQLVFEPTERGYQGSMSVTVTNGANSGYLSFNILEPVAGSLRDTDPVSPCFYTGLVAGRRMANCAVPGDTLKPRQRRTFSVTFEALTPTQPYAMSVAGGRVEVQAGETVTDGVDFGTLFRSTSGSLDNPRPYVQDSQAKASISTGTTSAILVRQPDGSYLGRIPVTVRWAGDAGHDSLWAEATALPAGVQIWGTDPQDMPSGGNWFTVPGGRCMTGDLRTFDVLLRAPAGTPVGELGAVTFHLNTQWADIILPDADPSDNTVTFSAATTA